MSRLFCIFSLIFFQTAICLAQTTRPMPAMSVSPSGVIRLTLGEKVLADGRYELMPPFAPNAGPGEMNIAKRVSSVTQADSATHARVIDSYPTVKATYDLLLTGEDLHIGIDLDNSDESHTLKMLSFGGLTFHFSRPADGNLHAWNVSYLLANGYMLYHPGFFTPLGVSFAHDATFGFSVFSDSEFDQRSLFNASWVNGQDLPAECTPVFFVDDQLAPAKSLHLDLDFRITTDTSIRHLFEPYKKIYDRHFPKLLYKPDNRPVAQFAEVDKSYVSRTNPLGFGGPAMRFDSEAGTRAYIRQVVPAMARANMLGIIFWSPGGWKEPMYPPEFDDFPPAVQKNIPTLVKGFKDAGLRVGLCARCGDGAKREAGKEPTTYRLSADDPEQMKTLMGRFHHAIDMGFDLFYLDSFGHANPNDLEILKKVRATVGPDVLLYTEYCTDTNLPYAGHYCEWLPFGLSGGVTPESYEALRYLCPDSTWICIDRTRQHHLPDYAKMGLVPLISAQAANHLPASQP